MKRTNSKSATEQIEPARLVKRISLSEAIGQELASEHPEIADLYREHTQYQLAKMFVPDTIKDRSVARVAVHYALIHLISRKEMETYGRKHRVRAANIIPHDAKVCGGENQSLEDKSRGGINSVVTKGFVPWTNIDEILYVLTAAGSSAYRTFKGSDNTRIAYELNEIFHNGEGIRNNKKVSNFLQYYRRKLLTT